MSAATSPAREPPLSDTAPKISLVPKWLGNPAAATLGLIAIAAVLRIVFGLSLGLGIDEAYAVATGRVFDWSYLDHPPLSWWMASASARLFGSEAALAVRLPFILLFAGTSWLMYRLTASLYGGAAGFFAVLLINLVPALGVTDGTFVLPDGPLVAAMLGGAICLRHALLGPAERAGLWWVAAGFCAGLALLSKYHGIFLLAGAGLFLVTSAPHRGWFLSPWPYLGAAIAAVMFAPVIVWNMDHQWASFTFQGGRAGISRFRPWLPLIVLGGQALFLTPWIWLPLTIRAWTALRKGPSEAGSWLLLCLAAGPILTFTLLPVVTGNQGLFHWAMPGYLLLFPLLGEAAARRLQDGDARTRRWLRNSAIATPALLAVVIAMALLPWPGLPYGKRDGSDDPLIETLEWANLPKVLAENGIANRPDVFVATERWHEAGRADYALRGALPVTCLCDDARGYAFKAPLARFIGGTALLIVPESRARDVEARFGRYFSSMERWEDVNVDHAGKRAYRLAIFIGWDFHPSRAFASLDGALVSVQP